MKRFFMTCLVLMYAGILLAQTDFSTCAGVYLKDQMIISEYSPEGVSKVSLEDRGSLRLRLIEAPEDSWRIVGPAQTFQVAIRDKGTQTLVMYSSRPVRSIELSDVLAKCEGGDQILILSTDRSLGVIGAEITVQ